MSVFPDNFLQRAKPPCILMCMIKELLAFASFAIIIGVTIPYMRDIAAGRAKPSRAARTMLLVLCIFALFQQHSLGSGLTLAVTVAEVIAATLLLGLSIRHGVGGWSRSDKACYLLLVLDLGVWALTKNPLLALHLTILADTIAFWPTLEKTWRDPKSETPLFFWGGVVAPLLSIAAGNDFSYAVIVFPLYLSAANLVEIVLINRKNAHR